MRSLGRSMKAIPTTSATSWATCSFRSCCTLRSHGEHGEFAIGDVTTAISEKMIRRHSHIFGGDRAADSEAVADLWAKNKMAERGQRTVAESMRGIARSLPATVRAPRCSSGWTRRAGRREDVAEAADALACAARRAAEGGADAEQSVGEALLGAVALAARRGRGSGGRAERGVRPAGRPL